MKTKITLLHIAVVLLGIIAVVAFVLPIASLDSGILWQCMLTFFLCTVGAYCLFEFAEAMGRKPVGTK